MRLKRAADLDALQRTACDSGASRQRDAPALDLMAHQALRRDANGSALLPLLAKPLHQNMMIPEQRADAHRQQQQGEQRLRQAKAALLTDTGSPAPAGSSRSSRAAGVQAACL